MRVLLQLYVLFCTFSCLRTIPSVPHDNLNSSSRSNNQLTPVVLVTSLGGAQIYAKWNFTNKPVPSGWNWDCRKVSYFWNQVWMNLDWFLPLRDSCWLSLVLLQYNSSSHTYDSLEGITTGVGNGTKNIRYVDKDPFLFNITYVYDKIIDALVAVGYTADDNLIAFPFDWRIGADAYYNPGGTFDLYKSTIESAYVKSGNKKVLIVGESMGNAMTNLFFNNFVNQTWKDKYIKAWISMSGIYAGAGIPLYSTVTLNTYQLPKIVGKELITTALRSFGGIVWLFPDPDYWSDYVFMSTPAGNYTAKDIPSILEKANLKKSLEMYNAVVATRKFTVRAPPNVTVYCWHGEAVPTNNYFAYDNDSFQNDPVVGTVSGDGSVPLESLEVCKKWDTAQSYPVYYKSLVNVTHQGILHNVDVIRDIVSVATATNVLTFRTTKGSDTNNDITL
ncbi:phosphatidylcholine-sterol acyltransferase-like isoform X2 [Oscarella lobularis]|uniref:phosphatidylcholine-sterol acyltransferase-like isoform X2 n=1 Tax=Oscarella lobularis TaxID=121494 RepID=UPI0033141E8E